MALDVLYVDSHLQRRLGFKQLAGAAGKFSSVRVASTLAEALERLRSKERTDVLYTSTLFDRPVLRTFLDMAKTTPQGERATYVLVFPQDSASKEEITSFLVSGIDGILTHPFSMDTLVDCTAAAVARHRTKSFERGDKVLRLLVQSLRDYVDRVWAERKYGRNSSFADLRRARSVLLDSIESIPSDRLPIFFDQLVNEFTAVPAPILEPRSEEQEKKADVSATKPSPTVIRRTVYDS